mgnify:CR=1 FL=1
MNWVLLSVIAGLFSAFFNYINRYILKDKGDTTIYAWFFEISRLLTFIVIALFNFQVILNTKSIIVLTLLGLTEFVSVYFFMKMHKFTEISLSTILTRTRLIWVPVLAFFFFKEKLTINEYFGIGILFLGLSIAVAPHRLKVDKGVKISSLSGFIIAVLSIIMKQASLIASTSVVMISMSAPSVFIFPFAMKNFMERLRNFLKDKVFIKLMGSVTNTASMYFYVLALKAGPVSKVTAIYQGMLIILIFAGIFFLNERKDALRKIIGGAITVVGIYLLT